MPLRGLSCGVRKVRPGGNAVGWAAQAAEAGTFLAGTASAACRAGRVLVGAAVSSSPSLLLRGDRVRNWLQLMLIWALVRVCFTTIRAVSQ